MLEVVEALVIAMALVIAVIYLFLGNLRATLVPAVTIPVSIIAAFIVMGGARVLDQHADAARPGARHRPGRRRRHRRAREHLPPHRGRANRRWWPRCDGSREIGFAVVATTLVLVAVFLPMSFLQGNVGKLFREFGFTHRRRGRVLVAGRADADADADVEAVCRRHAPLAHGTRRGRVLPAAGRPLRRAAAARDAPRPGSWWRVRWRQPWPRRSCSKSCRANWRRSRIAASSSSA